LELEQRRLDDRATEIQLSTQYRPIFQAIIDGIRAAISAYNAKTGSNFTVRLHDLPSNLYATPGSIELGTVVFAPDVKWYLTFYSERPAASRPLPYLQLNILGGQSSPADQLRINIDRQNLTVTAWGGGIATAAKLAASYRISSANDSVRKIVQQLVETQISSLPNQ
jgi:hypothetical protein